MKSWPSLTALRNLSHASGVNLDTTCRLSGLQTKTHFFPRATFTSPGSMMPPRLSTPGGKVGGLRRKRLKMDNLSYSLRVILCNGEHALPSGTMTTTEGEYTPWTTEQRVEWTKAVGHNLRSIRRSRGESLKQMQIRTGITAERLSSYERGDRRFTTMMLPALAEAYRVDVHDLFPPELIGETVRDKIQPHLGDLCDSCNTWLSYVLSKHADPQGFWLELLFRLTGSDVDDIGEALSLGAGEPRPSGSNPRHRRTGKGDVG